MSGVEQCPWCGSTIARQKFLEIEAKIREEEQKKLEATEASLKKDLEEYYATQYKKQRQADEKKAQLETSKAIAKITADRDAAATKLKEAQVREAVISKQAKEEAERLFAKELQKQTQISDKASKERDAASKKLKELEARETQIRKEAKDEAEKVSTKELLKQRAILEKDRDAALLKKDVEANREKESLQKKLSSLEREVRAQTANQLGDGAEIDLYESLRESFDEDRIQRVRKGENGADIIHDVMYKGKRCGRIVIDSKNHKSWENGFIVGERLASRYLAECATAHFVLCWGSADVKLGDASVVTFA
jgi:hypothetical protein